MKRVLSQPIQLNLYDRYGCFSEFSDEKLTFRDMHNGKPVSKELLIAKHTSAMKTVIISFLLLLFQNFFL